MYWYVYCVTCRKEWKQAFFRLFGLPILSSSFVLDISQREEAEEAARVISIQLLLSV